jgi:hypothetical protein
MLRIVWVALFWERYFRNLSFCRSEIIIVDAMRVLAASICLGFLICQTPLQAAASAADADSTLRKITTFAVGGVGVAGIMSEGERALREVLKQSDAVARLESSLPHASAAGQLYALLGLRTRDREVYQRALARYGQRDASVETMRGCILQREAFGILVKQIDHGDYDSALSKPGRKFDEMSFSPLAPVP